MTTSTKLALADAGQALAIALAVFAGFGPLLFAPGCATQPAPVASFPKACAGTPGGGPSWIASAVQPDASVLLSVTQNDPALEPYAWGYLPTSAGAVLGIKRLGIDGGQAVARGPAGIYQVHVISAGGGGCSVTNVSIPVTTPVPEAAP